MRKQKTYEEQVYNTEFTLLGWGSWPFSFQHDALQMLGALSVLTKDYV